jgi:hypothetical protein
VLSAVCLETAQADSHMLDRCVANCYVLFAFPPPQCSWFVCLHASTFGVEMKIWQQCYILQSGGGLHPTQEGLEIVKLHSYCRQSSFCFFGQHWYFCYQHKICVKWPAIKPENDLGISQDILTSPVVSPPKQMPKLPVLENECKYW